MKIIFNYDIIQSIDVDFFKQYNFLDDYIFYKAGQEHYKLLVYLSSFINNGNITELGTSRGYSVTALSRNISNQIQTFDIENLIPEATQLPKNITCFISGDVLSNKLYQEFMLNNYQGLLLLDDIFLNQNMLYFWGEIEKPKYDLTKYGHASGTGLVIFNPDIQVILE